MHYLQEIFSIIFSLLIQKYNYNENELFTPWYGKRDCARAKIDFFPLICVLPTQSWSSQEQSMIILCEFIIWKEFDFFLMGRKASISAYVQDLVGIVKVGENPLGQSDSNHQRIFICPFQGQL